MKTLPTIQEMQRAMIERESSYDGVFFVAVRTTGIFCRPSCPARKPSPTNVEYFPTVHEALIGGYRPCKRCRPMDTNGRPPEWVDRLLARIEAAPTERLKDADLRAMDIDPARARRYFRRHYGMTFQAYHRARRMGLALAQLRDGGDALAVAMDHGYESNSGFREAFTRAFKTPPGRVDQTECVVMTTLKSPLGPLLVGATSSAVCLLEFSDRRSIEKQITTMQKRLGAAVVPGSNEILDQLASELDEYFAGDRTAFDVPIHAPGTVFQRTVWEALLAIPYGQTRSYEQIAQAVGRPGAQRAVGRANGDNRIAIIIPCHRVVQKNGELRGYGGGLWRKQFLLDLERGTAVNGAASNGRDAVPVSAGSVVLH